MYLLIIGLLFLPIKDAVADSEHIIYQFVGGDDGMYPTGLRADAAGNLFGATEFTANYGPATIFELVKNGSGYKYVVLYTFPLDEDGVSVSTSLALDRHGNLYGTTGTGGDYYKGSVFKLSAGEAGNWVFTVLYSFSDGADGGYAYGTPVLDKAGNLYGTTYYGGLLSDCSGAGCGVVFELLPGSDGNWTETVLHSFAQDEGALPASGVVFGSDGVLYGTTSAGGTATSCSGSPANGCGTVFRLAPSAGGWVETTHSFDASDGDLPQSVTYHSGKLFGNTLAGGMYGGGTVFELTLTKSATIERVIHNFGYRTDVTQPLGSVTFDKEGNLYGSASRGGNPACQTEGCGAIFELTPESSGNWSEIILHKFTGGNDGAWSNSTPLVNATGLIGITGAGGKNGDGVVFELTP